MKHYISSIILLMYVTLTVNAQLKVNSTGNVGIGNFISLNPTLTIGGNLFSQNSSFNIGTASSVSIENGLTNIGLEGVVQEGYYETPFSNIGLRGMVNTSNQNQGRNYGVVGILAGSSSSYGGAGIFGSTSFLHYLEGVNISGKYAGYFDGPVNISGILSASNIFTSLSSSQENISLIGNRDIVNHQTLENLLNMNVIEYDLVSNDENVLSNHVIEALKDHPEYRELIDDRNTETKHHFGILPEDLKKVYPDLVEEVNGCIGINYIELVPLLIRSIQELKDELDDLKETSKSKRKVSAYSGINTSAASGNNFLFQCIPNPFRETTTIRFSLNDNVQNASIAVFDMTGKMLKNFPILSGDTSVTLNGGEFGEGIYLYTLIVEGQEVDTKKMIISK